MRVLVLLCCLTLSFLGCDNEAGDSGGAGGVAATILAPPEVAEVLVESAEWLALEAWVETERQEARVALEAPVAAEPERLAEPVVPAAKVVPVAKVAPVARVARALKAAQAAPVVWSR